MPVNLKPPGDLLPVNGIRLGVAQATIKRPGRDDVVLIGLDKGTAVAATFTRNAFAAAPVVLAKQHLAYGQVRAMLINSGNANAGTGQAGIEDAQACCVTAAETLGVAVGYVLPFSTGVIGERLPVERIQTAITQGATQMAPDGWLAAARAIMTTDTVPKGTSRQLSFAGGTKVTLTGIAKGSGMIRPDMATMLAFVGTDATLSTADLQSMMQTAVQASFNSITVDGDTSTNDACVLCATGASGAPALQPGSGDWQLFAAELQSLLVELAQAIVRDAEGATKFITVQVHGAATEDEARRVAFTVAHSPLVKTACFASDPNWGRILAAVGRAGLADLDITGVGIQLDQVQVVAGGEPVADYSEAAAAAVMAQDEFSIKISLGRGHANTRIWTSDLSYDYVKINAEYRT